MTPLIRLRIEKAASDCGFELTPVPQGDLSLTLRSASFPESVRVTLVGESTFLLASPIAELFTELNGDNVVSVEGFAALYAALQRASATARTLPNRFADKFRELTAKMPSSTEAERLVIQRVGQDLFRAELLDYWQGRCGVTGLSVPGLLRASHIKPWAQCETDDERLDVFNGLLLAPHVDALFDDGWISFADDGALLISPSLPDTARAQLGVSENWRVDGLRMAHSPYLAFHRQHELR